MSNFTLRRSISFSIAYVRLCEWASSPDIYNRPAPEILNRAEVHAIDLEDAYILEVIKKCRLFNKNIDKTPTPKLPRPTKESLKPISKRAFLAPNTEIGLYPNDPVGENYCLSVNNIFYKEK